MLIYAKMEMINFAYINHQQKLIYIYIQRERERERERERDIMHCILDIYDIYKSEAYIFILYVPNYKPYFLHLQSWYLL